MKTKSLVMATGLALAGMMGSGAASAISLFSNTLIEDDNIDYMSFDANNDGKLDVGDQLTAILDFTQIASIPPGSAYDPSELSAYSVIEVKSKVSLGVPGQYRLEFGPAASFELLYGTGAMVAMFDDPANNLNLVASCNSVAGCLANATDGALWAVLGLSDADDGWFSTGSDNVAGASVLNAATKVATINFALSFLTNNTGYTFTDQSVPCIIGFACGGDGMTPVIGSADILGGAGLAAGHVRSDTDATVLAVPEPATLGLLGLGLLGLGASLRRKS